MSKNTIDKKNQGKKSKKENKREITDVDRFGSIPKPNLPNIFEGIDLSALTGTTPPLSESDSVRSDSEKIINNPPPPSTKLVKPSQDASHYNPNERTNERSFNRSNKQTFPLLNKPISGQKNDLLNDQISNLMNERLNRPIYKRTNEPTHHHIQPVWNLTKNQIKVLEFLLYKENRITKYPEIEKNTGVPYGTVKRAVLKLVVYGFMDKPRRYMIGHYNGIQYKLNEQRCEDFLREFHYNNPDLISELMIKPITGLSNELPNKRSDSLISSSYLNTTTNIKSMLSCHPELSYWREKELTAKQIEYWTKIADCSLDNMIQYLCYCRFEMVDLGMEDAKPIRDVFDWFFRMIERTGGYPKPKKYKSFQEKQLEHECQIVEQKEKEAQEAEALYRRKIRAGQDKLFWGMMNDKESDLYNQCFESLNDFQKNRTSGKGFEMSMRTAFDRMTGYADETVEDSSVHNMHTKEKLSQEKR